MDRRRARCAQQGHTAQLQQRRLRRRVVTARLAQVRGKGAFWCPTVPAVLDTQVPMAVYVQCVLAELTRT